MLPGLLTLPSMPFMTIFIALERVFCFRVCVMLTRVNFRVCIVVLY